VIVGGRPGAHLVNLEEPWRRLRRCANLDEAQLRDLRHSFASVAIAGGLSLPMIGKLFSQGMPERSTNMMPARTWRSEMGGRPRPLSRRRGSRGAMIDHG